MREEEAGPFLNSGSHLAKSYSSEEEPKRKSRTLK